MTFIYITLGIISILVPATTMERQKLPFQRGINCNMESFQSVTHRVINRYFCVPQSACRPRPHRISVIPFDLCNEYYNGENGEALTCCHQSDFKEKLDLTWTGSFIFLPSFRSYIMCRHYSHTLCAKDGSSHCDKTTLEPKVTINTEGIPQIIERFPHTALVGYPADALNKTFRWFCMGSIVSERVIITASNCESELYKGVQQFSTHVKVGESIICDHCADRPGEQLISIWRWEMDLNEKSEIFFILLKENIHFNHKVRPACLLRQPYGPTKGWYVHYGKPETLITTAETIWPVFHYPTNKSFITFKVKTSQNAVIHLSESGTPNIRDMFWEIYIGKFENGTTQSSIRQGLKVKNTLETIDILNKDEFRGFWVKRETDGVLSFGEEDKTTPTLVMDFQNSTFSSRNTFDINVIGISTPNSTGEWVFSDHEGLFSLNGQEIEVLWKDKCAEYHKNFQTIEKYVSKTNDQAYIGEQEFCAGDLRSGMAPCDNDWGSTIQIMDRFNLPCMWQIFGLYSQNEKRNCSAVNSPGVFVNFANHLALIEETAYPTFSYDWFKLKVDSPLCLQPTYNTSDSGRCPAYILPK